MDQSAVNFLSVICLIIGFLGTFLPVLPGLVISFGGLLLYKYAGNSDLSVYYIWIFGLLTLLATVLSYTVPAKVNKKYGGTRWGSVGSFIGAVLGMFFIPVPFGFLIGMLLGVFFAELLHDSKNIGKALQSTKGSFLGFLYSTGFSMVIALAMFLVVIFNIFHLI